VAAIYVTDGGAEAPEVEYEALCPEWEPGVRIYLELPDLFCGWDLSASYTYLKSGDHASQEFDDPGPEDGIISPLLYTGLAPFDGIINFEFGDQHWDLYYNEWDVLLSYDICCGGCHHFTPFFGVAGIVLDQELTAEFENTSEGAISAYDFEWKSDYWGVGLRAGAAYQFDLNCGLSIYANSHATLLAGEANSKSEHFFEDLSAEADGGIEFKDDDCCHFVPGYHIAAGLAYAGCWCDWEIGARLGYEFIYWHNIPNHRVFFGGDSVAEASHSTSPHTRSIALHGLVAGVSLTF
jgi:hypothetical protein